MIFYYGAVLVASEFTVNDVMMVFSLLLFSIGYAAQILSWSKHQPHPKSERLLAKLIFQFLKSTLLARSHPNYFGLPIFPKQTRMNTRAI